MNVHDSERIKGLLESLGMGEARDQREADVLVFNTCTIREKADERFVAHLMEARAAKQRDPEKRIVVGGCPWPAPTGCRSAGRRPSRRRRPSTRTTARPATAPQSPTPPTWPQTTRSRSPARRPVCLQTAAAGGSGSGRETA